MLHSALPRAYLGAYLGAAAYFDDTPTHQHPYNLYAAQHHQQQQQEQQHHHDISYAAAQRAVFHAWTAQSPTSLLRSASPCPLDLSLKASTAAETPTRSNSPIEVDDDEDRRSREEARSHHSAESCLSGSSSRYFTSRLLEPASVGTRLQVDDEDVIVDDQDSRSSSHHSSSTTGYHLLQSPKSNQELYYQQQQQPCSPIGYHSANPQLLLTPPPASTQQLHAPMTPPSTPSPPQRPAKTSPTSPQITPVKDTTSSKVTPRPKKKHARKLKFDEDTSSPVSGTVILGPDEAVVTGDIDPAFNIVEVTEEARAELAKIENRLGPYQCKLCRQLHEDAFQLAQHRCSRIAHVEYRCPECDKRFSCPANLASHRRWHKPRAETSSTSSTASAANASQENLACTRCDAKFARAAALRKHLAQQHPPEQNNNNEEDGQQLQAGKEATLAMEVA